MGPFTLHARRLILDRVIELELVSGVSIPDDFGREAIERYWRGDGYRDKLPSTLAKAAGHSSPVVRDEI